jgi:hypothetical protein
MLSLIHTLYKSHSKSSWFPFPNRFLATASNSWDSSASCVQVLSSQTPVQNFQLTSSQAGSHFIPTSWYSLQSLTFNWLRWELVSVTLRLVVYRQSISVTSPLTLTTSNFIFQLNTCCYSPFVTSSRMKGQVSRLQLLLVLASTVILVSESHGTSLPHFTVSDLRLSHRGGSGPHIYIPQEQVGPVISPDTGLPFCCLLRLIGWRSYLTPPPHELTKL